MEQYNFSKKNEETKPLEEDNNSVNNNEETNKITKIKPEDFRPFRVLKEINPEKRKEIKNDILENLEHLKKHFFFRKLTFCIKDENIEFYLGNKKISSDDIKNFNKDTIKTKTEISELYDRIQLQKRFKKLVDIINPNYYDEIISQLEKEFDNLTNDPYNYAAYNTPFDQDDLIDFGLNIARIKYYLSKLIKKEYVEGYIHEVIINCNTGDTMTLENSILENKTEENNEENKVLEESIKENRLNIDQFIEYIKSL